MPQPQSMLRQATFTGLIEMYKNHTITINEFTEYILTFHYCSICEYKKFISEFPLLHPSVQNDLLKAIEDVLTKKKKNGMTPQEINLTH